MAFLHEFYSYKFSIILHMVDSLNILLYLHIMFVICSSLFKLAYPCIINLSYDKTKLYHKSKLALLADQQLAYTIQKSIC